MSALALTAESTNLSAGSTVAKVVVTADSWNSTKELNSDLAEALISSITVDVSASQLTGKLILRNGSISVESNEIVA